MHGNGTWVEGLNSSDVRAGPNQYLYPAVTIALPCYSGIASEKIYRTDKNNDNEYEEISIFYDPEDTFALSFIKKGCIGYIGHLQSGGINLGILQPALYGMVFLNMTQGEAMTYAYNKNLMIPAKPSPDWEHDLFSYLIYGDPAYKPVTNPLAPPILKGSTIVNPNHIDLELKFTQNVTLPTPLPEGNYNDEDKWSGVFNLPLHYQHVIPKNYEVTSLSVSSFNDPDGKITSIELHSWIIEETWNKQNLHIAFDLTWNGLHNICENTIISLKLDVNQLEPEPTPKPTSSPGPEPEKTNFDIAFDKDDYRVETISNSTVKDLIFKQTEKTLQLKIDGTTGTNGFCNITFPKVLLSGDFTVFALITLSASPTTTAPTQ